MSSLLSIFRQKLIPWAQEGLDQRLVVARPMMKKSVMPADVELTRTKVPGKRVIVRNKRVYGNQRIFYAGWPEAGLHELDVPKLVCILNGAGDFQAGEYIISCNQGHFIFLPPRTPIKFATHSHKDNAECSYTLLQINLYRDSIHCMMSRCYRGEETPGDAGANCLIYNSLTVQTFRLFVEELSSEQTVDFAVIGHLLSALFCSMSREINAGRQFDSFHVQENTTVPSSVQEIRDYIRTHLPDNLTIEKMARAMYMSPSQFTHYIKRESGQTFVEMLTECRIAEAKSLLCETKWSLMAIASRLGFKSSIYFGTFFRRHVGVPPGVYRKKPQNPKIQRKS